MKVYGRVEEQFSSFLNLTLVRGKRSASGALVALTPGKALTGIQRIRRWVGPTVGLDSLGNSKACSVPGIERLLYCRVRMLVVMPTGHFQKINSLACRMHMYRVNDQPINQLRTTGTYRRRQAVTWPRIYPPFMEPESLWMCFYDLRST